MKIDLSNTAQGGGSKIEEVDIDVSTLKSSRETYGRLVEAYALGAVSEKKVKTLSYLMNGLLAYWRQEADLRIEERLEAIEEALNAQR